MHIAPGSADATSCMLVPGTKLEGETLTASQCVLFSFEAHDSYGNRRYQGGNCFEMSITPNKQDMAMVWQHMVVFVCVAYML